MSRKEYIKRLETELKITYSQLYVTHNSGSGLHARHNKLFKRYAEILTELEKISFKWKIKKIIRRIKNHGKNEISRKHI